ncbi:hypothetical protein [uncultured Microbacterium sp.]|uniref:hypothetical protein n=1 Tax=Microbacterium algeriense TaxID=2615184 RepID=UPI00259560CC|nr:hypothetical protein [uncultured Microbacterium sp.]
MNNYTPTTEQVRTEWIESGTNAPGPRLHAAVAFDRWLAAHDAEVRARAFTSAAGIARSYDTGYDTTAASIAEALKESAGVVAEEPEWEYGVIGPTGRVVNNGDYTTEQRLRRRKAGPWETGCFGHCDPEGWHSPCRVPVKQEGAET